MSKSWDSTQAECFVGADLGVNCFKVYDSYQQTIKVATRREKLTVSSPNET